MAYDELHESEGTRMPPSGVRGFSPSALDAALSRKRAGSEDLADAIGVSRQSVAAWRAGKAIPTAVLLRKAAQWLDVPVADLVPIARDKLRISDLRIRAGLNQRLAASQIDLSATAIAEIEKGRRSYDADVAQRIATIYGVDLVAVRESWERTNAARRAHLDSL